MLEMISRTVRLVGNLQGKRKGVWFEPRGGLLLVSDGGSDTFWVWEKMPSIPLGTLFCI